MDNPAVVLCPTLQIISGNSLCGFLRPIGTDIGENLRSIGQQTHKQHTESVEHIIFSSEDHRFFLALKIEGGIQYCLGIITVGPVIRPLPLSLETCCNGIVAGLFLLESIWEIGISLHQIFDDTVHLNGEFPLLFLFLRSEFNAAFFSKKLDEFRVIVTTFFAVLLCPCQCSFIRSVVIDALLHTAKDLYFIHRLYAEAEIFLHKLLVDNRASDPHTHRADLQIAFSPHGCSGNGCTAKAQQLFLYIIRNTGDLVTILHLMAINPKRRKSLLRMGGQNRGQVYSPRTFRTIKAPDTLNRHRVHIHSFGAVAPARCDRQCNCHAFSAEFLRTGSRFRYAPNRAICNDHTNWITIGIAQVVLKQFFGCQSHRQNLILQIFS